MTPITDRAEINRANAGHSTGPQTVAGKQNSRYNALRHGLTSQMVVMPTEDLEAYHRHLKSFTDEYGPQGATEENLVQTLADTAWRLKRIISIESSLLKLAAINQLDVHPASIVAGLESQAKSLANLSLYTQRLSRQFERSVAQLRDLQQTRRAQEEHDLNDLLDVLEMYEAKGEPYNPSEDGFVFSEQQITESILARNRERAIDQAWKHRQAA